MRDLSGKVSGSQYTAEEFDDYFGENKNQVEDAGITLSSGDNTQLAKASANYAAFGDFYSDSGSANTYVLDVISPKKGITEYFDGMRVRFVAGNSNTGASTVNVNGKGVKDIVHDNGSALGNGQILVGNFITLVYKDSTGKFILVDDGQGGSIYTLPLPPDYRSGCRYYPNSTTPATKIDIEAGKWRSADDTINLTLVSTLIKQFDNDWAEGDDVGGFASGATRAINSPFHLFLIGKPNGATDAGFDDSITATNLLADASGSGYTKYRRIGTVYSTGTTTNLSDFIMDIVGDKRIVYWYSLYTDYNKPSAVPATLLVPLKTPADIRTTAIITTDMDVNVNYGKIYYSNPDQQDQTPVHNPGSVGSFPLSDNVGYTATVHSGRVRILTNTNRQIRFRTDPAWGGSSHLSISTVGWEE